MERRKVVHKLQLIVELTYDAQLMHGNDPEAMTWFFERVLGPSAQLTLFSDALGDLVGTLQIFALRNQGDVYVLDRV